MKSLNSLFYSIFIFVIAQPLFGWHPSAKPLDTCIDIEAKIEITNTSSGRKNGAVEVILLENDQKQQLDIFLIQRGEYQKVSDSKASGLAQGNYAIVISENSANSRFCPRYFNVTIH